MHNVKEGRLIFEKWKSKTDTKDFLCLCSVQVQVKIAKKGPTQKLEKNI